MALWGFNSKKEDKKKLKDEKNKIEDVMKQDDILEDKAEISEECAGDKAENEALSMELESEKLDEKRESEMDVESKIILEDEILDISEYMKNIVKTEIISQYDDTEENEINTELNSTEEINERINLASQMNEMKNLMESMQDLFNSNTIISKKISKDNTKLVGEVKDLRSIIEKDKNEEILELKRQISAMKNNEKKIMKNIIHMADQFDYIYNFAKQSESSELIESMDLVKKVVKKELSEIGIEEIDALGEQFSPMFHSCETAIVDETKNKDEIVEVIKKGYKRNGEVIRAAKVVAVMNK